MEEFFAKSKSGNVFLFKERKNGLYDMINDKVKVINSVSRKQIDLNCTRCNAPDNKESYFKKEEKMPEIEEATIETKGMEYKRLQNVERIDITMLGVEIGNKVYSSELIFIYTDTGKKFTLKDALEKLNRCD